MKVAFLTSYRDRYGADHKEGDKAEYSDTLGAKLIHLGIVAEVAAPAKKPVTETAEKTPPENVAKRTTKPRPRTRKTN